MKKYFYILSLVGILSWSAVCPATVFAYLSELKILEKKEIVKLTDESLAAVYLDVIIEIAANNINHKTAGFTPREYQQYKDFLRYQYVLKTELQKRSMDIPALETNKTP